jgi:hypothetical protein
LDRGAFALLNDVYFSEHAGLDLLYHPAAIRERAHLLRQYGWSVFSLKQGTYSAPVHLLGGSWEKIVACRGEVESATRLDSQRVALRGWLLPPADNVAPSWVFVLDESRRVVGYLSALEPRGDLGEVFGAAPAAGFFGGIDFKRPVAPGQLRLSLVAVFGANPERMCSLSAEIAVPIHETSISFGGLPGRAILGIVTEAHGRFRAIPSAPYPPLPNETLFALNSVPRGVAGIDYRFDVRELGDDDLVIPVTASDDRYFDVEIANESGPIHSFKVKLYSETTWNIWRVAIVPRSQLPLSGQIRVMLSFPNDTASGLVVGSVFATKPNAGRAALY